MSEQSRSNTEYPGAKDTVESSRFAVEPKRERAGSRDTGLENTQSTETTKKRASVDPKSLSRGGLADDAFETEYSENDRNGEQVFYDHLDTAIQILTRWLTKESSAEWKEFSANAKKTLKANQLLHGPFLMHHRDCLTFSESVQKDQRSQCSQACLVMREGIDYMFSKTEDHRLAGVISEVAQDKDRPLEAFKASLRKDQRVSVLLLHTLDRLGVEINSSDEAQPWVGDRKADQAQQGTAEGSLNNDYPADYWDLLIQTLNASGRPQTSDHQAETSRSRFGSVWTRLKAALPSRGEQSGSRHKVDLSSGGPG